MAGLTLKSLLSAKTGTMPVLTAIAPDVNIEDTSGKVLCGQPHQDGDRMPVLLDGETLGWVSGPGSSAVASLLAHLAAKETERRALAGEVLHLYREVHPIGQLSEQLAAVLELADVATSALEQALRIIPGSHAGLLLREQSQFRVFGDTSPLGPGSVFAASVLDRGVGEILNEYQQDGRAIAEESHLAAVICAPLMARQQAIGLIALADTGSAQYTAAHLKLLSTIAMQAATAIENAMASQQLLRREVERQALQLYLPPQVAELILSSGGMSQLEGVTQPLTVLYADIRGFTTMSEQMEAREIVHMLNEFFTAMSGIIFSCNGTLDKFIGDCIMALFGAPVPSDLAPQNALRAAIEMQHKMKELNASRVARNLHPFYIGIGLHCGPAVVGNIGSADRVQYTAIGDTVNVAARLVDKAAAGQIIVSEAIRESIPEFEGFESLGAVDLKGRTSKMGIYRVRVPEKR